MNMLQDQLAAGVGLDLGMIGPWIWPLLIWSIVWKGLALWRAARREEKGWFTAILVINTLGLLEIAYLLLTRKKVA